MSRLVSPISEEEYAKLTGWRKWMVDHPYWLFGMSSVVTGVVIIAIKFITIFI